jgi:hypothetical protein
LQISVLQRQTASEKGYNYYSRPQGQTNELPAQKNLFDILPVDGRVMKTAFLHARADFGGFAVSVKFPE